jgi:hypothetical protein
MLTGESRFQTSTPLGIDPRSFIMGSKRVDHWSSGTVYECSEIAGSPQVDQERSPKIRVKSPNLFLFKITALLISEKVH